MKKLLYILILLNILGCGKQKNNSLTLYKLKGKVKFIQETSYEATEKFGEIEMGKFKNNHTTKFDEKGNKIETATYEANGSLSSKSIKKYTENGNEIEEIVYSANGNLKEKNIPTKYDEKGNQIERISYNSYGKQEGKSTSKYDEKGNQIEWSWAFEVDSIEYNLKFDSKYDENGNQIEMNSLYEDGSIMSKNIYKNDEHGNVIEDDCFDASGRLIGKSTYTYQYDNNGNWIKKISMDKSNKFNEITIRNIEYYR